MKCLNVAHAGYEGFPANTMESIEKIKETQCDVLEMDVRCEGTRLYLSHDFRGEPELCVELQEALVYIKENAPEKLVGLDLKEPVFKKAFKLVKELEMEDKVIFTGSVFLRETLLMRGESRIFYNLENSLPELNALSTKGDRVKDALEKEICKAFEWIARYPVDGVNLDYRLLTKSIVQEAEKRHLKLAVWTVDEISDMSDMIALGVCSITTKRPEELAELLGG